MSRSAAFFASLLVTLGRPSWWLLALAGFLARGGILLAILPVVNLPSPLVLSDMVAPVIVPLALGRVDAAVVLAIVLVAVLVIVWLVGGGLVGAATDLALIRDGVAAAAEEGVIGPAGKDRQADATGSRGGARVVARILVVRLLAHVPFAIALAIGSIGVVDVVYAELTRPADLGTPLVIRVLVAAIRPIIAIVIAWFLGELVGGIAERRVVLNGEGVRVALGRAIVAVVRRPRSAVVPALVTTIPLAVILGGTLGGARVAWLRADGALTDPTIDWTTGLISLMTFVAIWLAALVLIGLLAAARSAAITFEAVRDRADRHELAGTFGASTHHRPGDRPVHDDGGSL